MIFYLLLVLAISACQFEAQVEEVKVGVLHGNQYSWQKKIKPTIENFINKQSYEMQCQHKKKLKVIYKDTLSTQEGAYQAFNDLINNEHVSVILGPNTSDTALPLAVIAERAKIPMISIGSSHPELTKDKQYVFQLVVDNRSQAQLLSQLIYQQLNYQSASVIYRVTSDYSRDFVENFTHYFSEMGGQINQQFGYKQPDDIDAHLIEAIKKNQPDFILLPNFTEDIKKIVPRLINSGVKSTLVGTDAWNVHQLKNFDFMENTIALDHWYSNTSKYKEINTHENRSRAANFDPADPHSISPITHDTIALLWQTLCSSPETTSKSLVEYLQKVRNFQGITGTIKHFEQGTPLRDMVIVKISNRQVNLDKTISVEYLAE